MDLFSRDGSKNTITLSADRRSRGDEIEKDIVEIVSELHNTFIRGEQ